MMRFSFRKLNAIFGVFSAFLCFSPALSFNPTTQINLDNLKVIVNENVTQVKTLETIFLPMVNYTVAPILCFAFSPIDTTVAYATPSDTSQISIWNFAKTSFNRFFTNKL